MTDKIKQPMTEEEWEVWRDLIMIDGKIDIPSLKNELADFRTLLENARSVYGHVTDGGIFNPLAEPGIVNEAADSARKATEKRRAMELLEMFTDALGGVEVSMDDRDGGIVTGLQMAMAFVRDHYGITEEEERDGDENEEGGEA